MSTLGEKIRRLIGRGEIPAFLPVLSSVSLTISARILWKSVIESHLGALDMELGYPGDEELWNCTYQRTSLQADAKTRPTRSH